MYNIIESTAVNLNLAMHPSDPYRQSYESYAHSLESFPLSSSPSWRVQDPGAVSYYPPTSYDAPNDFRQSCFPEERMRTVWPSGHDVQGMSTVSDMLPSYNPPTSKSFNAVGSNSTNDIAPSNPRLNATAITHATYIEDVLWNTFSTQSSTSARYSCYTNTDIVSSLGANTSERQVLHSQLRSQLVGQKKRGHSCGLGCEDVLQDSEILRHMNQRHQDKKGGMVYCLDHKQAISWKNYVRHIRTKHLNLKLFRCDMCRKPFDSKFNAIRHMEESCSARRRA